MNWDGVAEPLLGCDEHRPAADILAGPGPAGQRRHAVFGEPRLVERQAFAQVAGGSDG